MNKLMLLVLSMMLGASALAAPSDFMELMDRARAGDYQAQRNVAYGFAAAPHKGQQKNAVLGCAWYLVVLNSGSPKVDVGDEGNARVYCGKLSPDLLQSAKHRAQQYLAEIYR